MNTSKKLTAIQLQSKKLKAELKIMHILGKLNQVCVDNHFHVETIQVITFKNDQDRSFDVDISII
jgi:hypothetical protein